MLTISSNETLVSFPISFNTVWKSLNFSRKDCAKRNLLSYGFIENIDFLINNRTVYINDNIYSHNYEDIILTVNCFEKWKEMNKHKKDKKYTEKIIANKIAQETNGKREINTESGKIDVLNSRQIIEVKNANDWKSALGQILVYSYYYPSHQKRIHLFGNYDWSFTQIIEKHCQNFNVIVTWEVD